MKLIIVPVVLALASLATARRQESPADPTEAQMANFTIMSQYAGAAYCNSRSAPGTAVVCVKKGCPVPEAHGAVIYTTFSGFLSNVRGYIAIDNVSRLIIVSFRGTNSGRNALADILAVPIPCRALAWGCRVHAGFYGTWVEVRRPVMRGVPAALALHPGYGVVVTGHSLGGAVATLAGAYLRRAGVPADVYTYGSPRVGNEAFAAFASTQSGGDNYRLTHSDDPVPRLPPLVMGYRHLTSEYWIEEGDAAAGKPYILSLCPGTANVNCNGAGSGLNVPAHSMYLGKIGACDTVDQMWRRERLQTRANVSLAIEEDALDANGAGIFPLDTREPGLVYLVNMFAERDRQFAATLEGAANYEA